MTGRVRVAAAAYPIERLADWAAYEAKITAWAEDGARTGAQILAFPEYGAMELASIWGERTALDLEASKSRISDLAPEIDQLHAALAARLGVVILAASLPLRLAEGRFVNRARLFGPEGGRGFQDKLIMTPWERADWGISGAGPAALFETGFGRIGVSICYDAEFPLIARTLAEAGMEILLVPSCTETLAGYHRVRIGAMARALEGQCAAVQAVTVGAAPWSAAVDLNRGAAGVFAPPDHGFPEDGVLALGGLDQPGWTAADIDLAALRALRDAGAVRCPAHWPEQTERLTGGVRASVLR